MARHGSVGHCTRGSLTPTTCALRVPTYVRTYAFAMAFIDGVKNLGKKNKTTYIDITTCAEKMIVPLAKNKPLTRYGHVAEILVPHYFAPPSPPLSPSPRAMQTNRTRPAYWSRLKLYALRRVQIQPSFRDAFSPFSCPVVSRFNILHHQYLRISLEYQPSMSALPKAKIRCPCCSCKGIRQINIGLLNRWQHRRNGKKKAEHWCSYIRL